MGKCSISREEWNELLESEIEKQNGMKGMQCIAPIINETVANPIIFPCTAPS